MHRDEPDEKYHELRRTGGHKSAISVAIAEDERGSDVRDYSVVENRAAILVKLVERLGRRKQSVLSNALEPGWVPTKLVGPGAPDDLSLAPVTQAWLAVSDDPAAMVRGQFFYHQQRHRVHPAATAGSAGRTAQPLRRSQASLPCEFRKED